MKTISINLASSKESNVAAFVAAFAAAATSMSEALDSGEGLRAEIRTHSGEAVYIRHVHFVEPDVLVFYGKTESSMATVVVTRNTPELVLHVVNEAASDSKIGFHAIAGLYEQKSI